jgi:hypothetical protein
MHRPRRAGIGGTLADGAESIVLSGSYEDDVDLGETVWYAGHGGHDIKTGRQVAHQALDRYNAALTRSYEMGKHIRLIRGAKLQNEFAPQRATATRGCTESSRLSGYGVNPDSGSGSSNSYKIAYKRLCILFLLVCYGWIVHAQSLTDSPNQPKTTPANGASLVGQ